MKTELHISAELNALETESGNGIDSSSSDDNSLLSIFRIRNSTVSLISLCLHSEGRSSLIASVSSSFVRVSESDIRSNGMNSPFVMLAGMVDGQSGDIGSCLDVWNCRHISSSLLSLVPLAELSRKSDLALNGGKGWTGIEERGFASSIRISARSLSICDCCLTFGTGPLIGFGSGREMSELGRDDVVSRLKVSSQLISSCVMNTTSTPSNMKVDELFGMELTQVVTGSRVCSCTNHLYGTACVDMNANVMGSLLSLNTSFWSCLTDTPTHLGQHFTDQQTPTQSAFFKLCTFKDCSSSSEGGAIHLNQTGSLLVEECSFQACVATGMSGSGGAIFLNASTEATFKAESSSFVGCSSEGSAGGSIHLYQCPSSTLIGCVFVDSITRSHGGCIFSHEWDALSTSSSITNCLFENCSTTSTESWSPYSGGALYFTSTVSIQLNFVNFRGNKAGANPGNDIMIAGPPFPLITSERIVGCTSTSASPRLRVLKVTPGNDDHLPNPPTTAFLVSCVGTSFDSDTAEFTLKMSQPMTGTVLVLIDNSGGTRTPTSEQAPNIGRVLAFSFDNSDSSSCRVSLGESGLAQTPLSAYSVVESSFVGSVILSASCVLDESGENALVTISGKNIPSGILSVTLSDNTVLDFEFLPNQTTSEVLTVPLTENSPKLRFGETYTIVRARSQTQPTHRMAVPYSITFIVPNPPRLTTLNEAEYDSALKTVRISLEGVDLEGTYKVTLSVNRTETVTIDVVFSSSQGQLGGILFDTDTPTNVNVSYNTRYEIVEMKKDDVNVVCMKGLSFTTIAEPTRVNLDSITPNSICTFIHIQLFGNGFIGQYAVKLTSGFSFVITAQSSTSAVSEEMALGRPDSLAFDTPFTIQSIVSMNPDSVVLLKDTLTFTTPKKLDPLSLFVDGRTGETSRFCGESTRPCLSVEIAWEIIAQLEVSTPTIGIVHSATLGSPIRISNGMVALLSNFGNVDPTLRIPSSACDRVESGLIVVSSSTLEIRDVDIVIDSLSPSFVLLSAQNSNLTLKEGSFVGPQSTTSSNDELSEEICSWSSGILQLDNCTTSISDTKLNHLSFGAINMKNGSLTDRTSSFDANSPNLPSFPSLRQNIRCSDGGHIEIGSLTGGDGVGTRWDGSLALTALCREMTTFTKKTGTFEIEIVGTILIPCGLLLEVFEKTKDKKEGNQLQFDLTLDSTQSFTDKTIKLAISQADLKELKGELEWRGRLVFGESHQTVETILIQKSISERRSEAALTNMKWWLPVVIVASCVLLGVIVIVVVCRRCRKNEKQPGATTTLTEMEEQEDDVEKIAVDVEDEHNLALIRTTREEQYHQDTEKNDQPFEEPTRKDSREDEVKLEEIEAVMCDGEVKVEVVRKRETLFERLHGRNKKAVDAIVVCRALIKGLVTAGKDARLNGALLTLSPHTVVVDSSNRICIVSPSEVKSKVGVESGKEMNGSVVEGEERWRAPEQGDGKIEAGMGSEKVSVFRLGLLLVEMWTGRIPFGETDGVNASRQLGMGILPPLVGMSCEMAELVGKCLSVDCGYRPRLLEMDEVLESLRKKDGQKVEGGEVQKNAADQTVYTYHNESVSFHLYIIFRHGFGW
ncbi:hypothetical protein BLNAU_3821 [Blattamonas nauphoetae]|uniref:Protein kinase domain-containing protein n=1 Tax=Blattamonas nauphoetae TaxID=2049346 RepID=A0ABQ9YB99_9EUKA|nr:hypothetical protein BLNAU_3821 [Blattamonas nauphoetae]